MVASASHLRLRSHLVALRRSVSRASARTRLLLWAGLSLVACLQVACTQEDTNRPPVANAGPDQTSYVRRIVESNGTIIDQFDEVSLDASLSSDPDGDYLTRYFWQFDVIPVGSQLDVSSLSVNRDDSSITRFIPDHEGIYGLTLEVFDGQRVSLLDYVQVEVLRQNAEPVANAGSDLNGVVGETLTFDGSSSMDPDGDFLSYEWELVVVPPGSSLGSTSLIYPATPNPRIVPDVEGVYALALTVFDGLLESAPGFVTLTVGSGNDSPVIVMSPSTVVTPCYPNPVTLDASDSYDPEGDAFSFHWTVLETPYGSLVRDSSLSSPLESTTQVTLDLYGLYVFGLTLEDGISAPISASMALLFDNGSTQVPPVADPGGNRTQQAQTVCTSEGCPPCDFRLPMDGTNSSDPNGDPLSYQWEVVSGQGSFVDSTAPITELLGPTLTPSGPGRILNATMRIQLIVADCVSASPPVESSVYFTCEGI